MLNVLLSTLDAAGFLPHGYCLQWRPVLLWTIVASDSVTAASYFSIPFALWFFANRRPDVPRRWLLVLFGLFVMACGTTHLFDVVNMWRPRYELDALARLTTALLSLTTAVVLWRVMPSALKAPSVQQLEASNRKLRELSCYSRNLIEASLDPLMTISADGRIMDVNRATEQVTGLDRERLIGSEFPQHFTEPDQARAGYREAYAEGKLIDYPLAVRHVSGRVTDVLCNASVYRSEAGQVAGVFVAARDFTERKQVEQQLEFANQELEAFCYSVSHDLRAPLRGIDGWSLALLEDFGPTLDPTASGYLELVRGETQRMGRLIDDLLLLSRVGRHDLRREPVNLSAMTQAVADRLRQAEPERIIEFMIEPGLAVNGDAHLLEIAVTNLLDNACKFSRSRQQTRIEFGSLSAHGGRVYFVRDNGIGFDMSHADKLFGAFQRLHKASEFPGTGIGLATVQRIIHRHRGKIWAEAEVGRGATFFFTLGDTT